MPFKANDDQSDSLLSYEVTTHPNPLQARPEDDLEVERSTLTIVVSNPLETPVLCKEIQIKIPHGTQADRLTDDLFSLDVRVSSKAWKFKDTKDGLITLSPKSGDPFLFDDDGGVIELYHIRVNEQVGTVLLTIQEQTKTQEDQSSSDFETRTAVLPIPKFPYGFQLHNFRPLTPLVANGESVTLKWDGYGLARYEIAYGSDTVTVVDVSGKPQWKSPPLNRTTTFILRAFVTDIGAATGTVEFDLTTTVMVANPEFLATQMVVANG